ncbi:MAG: ATP-binding cassette domain-containing protein [Aquabacterium sp.]|nr:ATP-binding cassette domain-containing protein [Aquabacterium sp.]
MSDKQTPRALSVELRLQQPGLDIRAQFRVLPGRVCALVGRTGSGKSALLKATAGLEPALGGRIALGNEAVYDSAAKLNKAAHERRLTLLDAGTHLFPHLNVKANLQYGLKAADKKQASVSFDKMVAWLDLSALLHRKPADLTISQRVRVALGRALLSAPNALLLDDPLGDVPTHEQEPLLELISQVPGRFKLPIVLVSPRMNEVIRLADEVVILHEGRMASAGPAAQILSDVSLSTFLEGVHAGSVLEGEVKRHDIDWVLSEVDVSGQRVTVPALLHSVGSKVRLKVRARDITLHKAVPTDTSCSNHLRGRITQVMLAGEHGTYGAVGIELDRALDTDSLQVKASAPLWAMLTRKSIQQMDWAPGKPCVVSFKAMATAVSAWR